MEWLVKKSCCNKQDNRHVLMLCDAGGAIKMIAEVKSDFAVKVGDLLSPLQNALYCINRSCTDRESPSRQAVIAPMSGNGSVQRQGKLSNVVLSWAGKSASTRS